MSIPPTIRSRRITKRVPFRRGQKSRPDAKLLEEKPITLNKSGVKYDGFNALFSFRDKFVANTPQDLLSKLIVFRRGDYYVLYRISYALSDKKAAESQISDFIDQLAWPAGDGSAAPSK